MVWLYNRLLICFLYMVVLLKSLISTYFRILSGSWEMALYRRGFIRFSATGRWLYRQRFSRRALMFSGLDRGCRSFVLCPHCCCIAYHNIE
jgi:hypothetical protein